MSDAAVLLAAAAGLERVCGAVWALPVAAVAAAAVACAALASGAGVPLAVALAVVVVLALRLAVACVALLVGGVALARMLP